MQKGLGLHMEGLLRQAAASATSRLRQVRADQGVRPDDGQARRPARSTRRSTSRSSSRRARRSTGQARRRRPVVGDRHDRPAATATSSRWPRRADYGQSKFNLAAQGHRQPGSSFKVMALMTALREGVNPNSTRYTSVSPMELNDPPCGRRPVRRQDLRRQGRRQHDAASRRR